MRRLTGEYGGIESSLRSVKIVNGWLPSRGERASVIKPLGGRMPRGWKNGFINTTLREEEEEEEELATRLASTL